jgi:uncharacterized protein (TIGR02001 family)
MTPCNVLLAAMKHIEFKPRDARAPSMAILAIATIGIGMAANANAADLSGNATLTTDYVWRGSTQTQGDPAVQAGFKLSGDSGFYASAWGSNVKFAPEKQASSELDFTVGWGKRLNDDWAIDVNVLRYQYPSTALDLNWTELNGTVTYKDRYWASVGHSNEALAYDASGTYLQAGAKFPINDTLRIEASVARYFLDDAVLAADGYSHAQLSGIWAFKAPFELRLTAHATDSDAKAIFGDDFAGSRIEAALQASF